MNRYRVARQLTRLEQQGQELEKQGQELEKQRKDLKHQGQQIEKQREDLAPDLVHGADLLKWRDATAKSEEEKIKLQKKETLIEKDQALLKDKANLLEGDVTLWIESVSDVAQSALPDESALHSRLKILRQEHGTHDVKTPDLLAKATKILEEVQDINTTLLAEPGSDELQRQIKSIIIESYVRSPWFYIPVAILFLATIFAVTGAIQIQDQKIEFRGITQAAIDDAKRDIDAKADRAEVEIDTYKQQKIGTLDTKFETGIAKILQDTKEEKSPQLDLNIKLLTNDVASAKVDLTETSKRARTIKDALNELEQQVAKWEKDGNDKLQTKADGLEHYLKNSVDTHLEFALKRVIRDQKDKQLPKLDFTLGEVNNKLDTSKSTLSNLTDSIKDAQEKMEKLEEKMEKLEKGILPLAVAIESITKTKDPVLVDDIRVFLERSGIFIDSSKTLLWLLVALSGVALILALFATMKSFK